MIKIYRRSGGTSTSFRKAVSFFTRHKLSFEIIRLSKLTKSDLLAMLCLSDGFSDLIITKTEAGQERFEMLSNMTTSQLMDYCLKYPEILREPICMDEKRLLIGYNADEIRQFLPREFREAELQRN